MNHDNSIDNIIGEIDSPNYYEELNAIENEINDIYDNVDLVSARKAILSYKGADTIKTIPILAEHGKNYEEWKVNF